MKKEKIDGRKEGREEGRMKIMNDGKKAGKSLKLKFDVYVSQCRPKGEIMYIEPALDQHMISVSVIYRLLLFLNLRSEATFENYFARPFYMQSELLCHFNTTPPSLPFSFSLPLSPINSLRIVSKAWNHNKSSGLVFQ